MMNGDLISRKALQDSLRASYDGLRKIHDGLVFGEEKRICNGELATFLEVLLRVKQAPAIDAVPVVRCKDCLFHGDVAKNVICCLLTGQVVLPNGFCNWGEKMDGGLPHNVGQTTGGKENA